ncbi:triose-phosphate isomerase, partial [Komagataeibacter oboediens]|uniref:triose-phosphate isomerase n=1 Tax=Komagataeibacter oboediens TaxID=65958 RepID=UPI001C2BCE1E
PVGVQPFVIPPFTSLRDVCAILEGTSVLVGAQNTHWEDEGPWTGEISPVMLAECGAALVEIGHSERRAHFGETDWTVNLKVHAVLRHGMRPLVCIGDTAHGLHQQQRVIGIDNLAPEQGRPRTAGLGLVQQFKAVTRCPAAATHD